MNKSNFTTSSRIAILILSSILLLSFGCNPKSEASPHGERNSSSEEEGDILEGISISRVPMFVYWGDHHFNIIDYQEQQITYKNYGIYKTNTQYAVSVEGQIYNFDTYQQIGAFDNPSCIPYGSYVTENNLWFVSCFPASSGISSEGFIQVWDIETQTLIKKFDIGGTFESFIPSPDGTMVLTSGSNQYDQLFHTDPVEQIPLDNLIQGTVYPAANGDYFTAWDWDRAVVWKWTNSSFEQLMYFDYAAQGITVSPDGSYVGYCTKKDDFIVIEREKQNTIFSAPGLCSTFTQAVMSEDGSLVMVQYNRDDQNYLNLYNIQEVH